MESVPCVFLGIKVKPGPIERFKLENFGLDNTVENLKIEAEKKSNVPSASLELIHHGKILKPEATLQDSGVKNGEMVHVVKKKVPAVAPPPPTYSDSELQQIANSLRTLGCTPNAPGWTRAMQLLNDESAMNEILEHAPSLREDCVTLSMLREVELLAALGATVGTMRRAAAAHPALPAALRQLTRLVHARAGAAASDGVPTSGFAYSLEALSEDEDADGEENEEGERNAITQEQFAAALQAATEAVSSTSRTGTQDSLLRLLQAGSGSGSGSGTGTSSGSGRTENSEESPATGSAAGTNRSVITPEMFSEAISEVFNRTGSSRPAATPMEQSTAASSSASPVGEDFTSQLTRMHEMGLLDDALNVRALLICAGDVNAAINLVFSGAITDE